MASMMSMCCVRIIVRPCTQIPRGALSTASIPVLARFTSWTTANRNDFPALSDYYLHRKFGTGPFNGGGVFNSTGEATLQARSKVLEEGVAKMKKDTDELRTLICANKTRINELIRGLDCSHIMSTLEKRLVDEVKAAGAEDPTILTKAEWYHLSLLSLVELSAEYEKHILAVLSEEEWRMLAHLRGTEEAFESEGVQRFSKARMVECVVVAEFDTPEEAAIKHSLLGKLFARLGVS